MSTELSAALGAWIITRHPAVGAAVRALSARALEGFAGPTARTKEAFDAAWHDLAASDPSPEATGWLAAHLEDRLPFPEDRYGMLRPGWMETRHAPLFRRLDALAARCPDPRVADAVAELLERARYGFWEAADSAVVYGPPLALAVEAGDPSIVERLRAIATGSRARRANVREHLAAALPPVIEALGAIRVGEADPAWAAYAEPAPRPASGPDIPQLLEALYADPGSDEVRAVLADAWLERGDPRGEFVALQLLPERTEAQEGRARKLLREHQAEWLGPDLAAVLKGPVFARGFLDEAELAQNAAASQEVWEAASADPRLATVRALRQGRGNREHYRRFVMSPAMRDLRRVEVPIAALLEALADGPPRTIEALVFERAPNRKQLARIASAPALARVDTLAVDAGGLDELLVNAKAGGLQARIARMELLPNFRAASTLARFWDIVGTLPRLEHLALPAHGRAGDRNGHSFARGPDGWSLTLVDHGGYLFATHRGDVPLGLVRASVALPGPARPGLQEQLEREWGCPVELQWL